MAKIQDILKKINYIEADIEIHKQILFSIPSDQKDEIEKTLRSIAAKKEEINSLREQIREQDPEEFARIIIFEKAISQFKELATTKNFTSITGRNIEERCVLSLKNGNPVDCLIKACDADGNWTIITLEGDIKHFFSEEVTEKSTEKTTH